MRTSRRLATCSLLALVTVCVAGASGADEQPSNAYRIPLEQCTKYPPDGDGVRRQHFAKVDVTGGIAAIPPRTTAGVKPSMSGDVCVGFQNRTGHPVNLALSVGDVGADDSNGAPTTSVGATLEYGASRWLSLPNSRVRLAHGDIAWLLVPVKVPSDVAAGSYYASVVARDSSASADHPQISLRSSVVSQVFFDIPGSAARSGNIEKVHMPRIVWWDGLGLGDLPVLEHVKGLGFSTARFEWRNTGSYTDNVGGRMTIRSSLSKKVVARIPIDERAVIRGSSRPYAVSWDDGIPLLGRFTPTIEIAGGNGISDTQKLPAVWVIPSWWYLLALVLALAIPITLRRRSKRRYRSLEERVAAAEAARAEQVEHDEWDD